jgi:AraC-like DNA-binding protein
MSYLVRAPSPPLARFIERIWYCSDVPSHSRERVLPGGGNVDLIVNLVEDEIRIYDADDPQSVKARAGSFVSGTSTRSFFCDPRQRESVIGVHFRPGGAFPFLGISPLEIVDTHAPLDDLWGCTGRNLREQLVEASSASERFDLIEAALLSRLRSARPGHPATSAAIAALHASDNAMPVAELAAAVGLSHRRFAEVFEREVGLPPKLFARLRRFHRVKQGIAAQGEPRCWATFALACGYFDQSHMIRDFVGFSGVSPSRYARGRDEETAFDHFVHAYPT